MKFGIRANPGQFSLQLLLVLFVGIIVFNYGGLIRAEPCAGAVTPDPREAPPEDGRLTGFP